MKARTFFTGMLLFLVLTGVLTAFALRSNPASALPEPAAQNCCSDDSGPQAADGGMIWESVSTHLLNAVQ